MHDNMTSHHRSPHPMDLRRRDPVVGTISVDAGLHAACAPFMDSVHTTRCCVFACCAAHTLRRSDQSQVVCPDLPHGDVRLCRRRRLPSLRHRRRPFMRPSTNGLWFLVILTGAWFLLHPVRPFCLTPSASSTAFYRTDRDPSYHPVSLFPVAQLAPTDRATHRCLTAVCHCLNYHPPLTLRHKYNCQVAVIKVT